MADTHTVMTKKLAQALMESSMQHFDSGGTIQSGPPSPYAQTEQMYNQDPSINNAPNVLASGSNPANAVQGIAGVPGNIANMMTAQNRFQAGAPPITIRNFEPQQMHLQGQQDQAYTQQQNLANQLMAQSRGQGPSVAQNQLNQATGQNVAAQGAMMAGQRGASSNVGLMARQIANQGAQTQQSAAGQAATLRAQEQLGAQGQLSNVYGNMANQSLQGQSIMQSGQAAQNNAITTGAIGASNINANIAGQNTSAQNQTTGGLMNMMGAGLANSLARGGTVKGYADGGIANYGSPSLIPISNEMQGTGINLTMPSKGKPKKVNDESTKPYDPAPSVPTESTAVGREQYAVPGYDDGGGVEPLIGIQDYSKLGKSSSDSGGSTPMSGIDPSGGKKGGGGLSGIASLAALLAHGGHPNFSKAYLSGGPVNGKPKVNQDNAKNDVVPAMLSPGEEVIDLDTLNDKGPVGKAARMVAAHINAKKAADDGTGPKAKEFLQHLKSKKKGYGSVIEARCGGGRM